MEPTSPLVWPGCQTGVFDISDSRFSAVGQRSDFSGLATGNKRSFADLPEQKTWRKFCPYSRPTARNTRVSLELKKGNNWKLLQNYKICLSWPMIRGSGLESGLAIREE
jgi:hypothetical protein